MPPASTSPPRQIRVRIEVSRGSHIKRGSRGGIDFVSPLPCPWNYGSALHTSGSDGEPLDVVVLGEALAAGSIVDVQLQGHIPFLDQGLQDDKWVGSTRPLSSDEIHDLESFFRRYAQAKRIANRLRRKPGEVRAESFIPWAGEPQTRPRSV